MSCSARKVRWELSDILALDRRVHRFIYRAAKNPYLLTTLEHYHNLFLRILYVAMKRFLVLVPRLEDALREQIAMLRGRSAQDHMMGRERGITM
jgi:DNA-binding GntR family transcriptional regulator